MHPDALAALEKSAAREYASKTDVINRAVQLYDFVGTLKEEGKTFMIKREDGSVAELLIL